MQHIVHDVRLANNVTLAGVCHLRLPVKEIQAVQPLLMPVQCID